MYKNVFTYGSLMFPEVWSHVVHSHCDSAPASLAGYQRLAVHNEEYPVAVSAQPANIIQGMLYFDVPGADISRLDRFEGEYYQRLTVTASTVDEAGLCCEVYVLKQAFSHIASVKEWDAEAFGRGGLQRFLQHYGGFLSSQD